MDRVVGVSGVFLVSAVGLLSLGASQHPAPPLPNSELPVTLLGVAMDSAMPARSACLVRCSYRGEKQTVSLLLATGQRVCDVAEITEILRETVVIKNLLTNRLELLTLPRTDAAPNTTSATTEPPPTAPGVVESRGVVESPNIVTIEVRKDVVDRYLANLPELLSSAVATPHYRDVGNGQSIIEGFEINSIKEASAARQLGLRNGDVVLEVNGDKLDSAASVIRLLSQVPVMAQQAKLIVLREGRRMTLVVNVKLASRSRRATRRDAPKRPRS